MLHLIHVNAVHVVEGVHFFDLYASLLLVELASGVDVLAIKPGLPSERFSRQRRFA